MVVLERWGFHLTLDRLNRSVHFWIGPAGLHLFWPMWDSRFDWRSNWREPVE